jgi:curved DNA-binding protein CbpA
MGLEKGASLDELKKASKKLSLLLHPDKNPDDPEGSNAKFIQMRWAYDECKREIAPEQDAPPTWEEEAGPREEEEDSPGKSKNQKKASKKQERQREQRVNPTPSTLNPKPSTPHLNPQTVNLKL